MQHFNRSILPAQLFMIHVPHVLPTGQKENRFQSKLNTGSLPASSHAD